MEAILGLGLALPITAATGISVTTGVAQGVSEQQRQNADASNQERQLRFHLDITCEDPGTAKPELRNCMVTLHDDKLWVEPRDPSTRLPDHHPFTGFFVPYPLPADDPRPTTRGLVSTISRDPPMLNWIYVDKNTHEVKYANRTGSINHYVGNFDWDTDTPEPRRHITFVHDYNGGCWEGFMAVEEARGKWALYFDCEDVGEHGFERGRKTADVCLVRRVLSEQETNKWGLAGEGNIGFRKTREV